MSEEAKVRHADEMKLQLSYNLQGVYIRREKIEVREKSGSLKIRKLESNNRDVDRDSNESYIDESFDSLRPVEILSTHSCSAALSFIPFLRPATLAFVSFFVIPILPE